MVNIALLSAAHVHTRGFLRNIAEGTTRPTQVDRLVAAITGQLTREELDADLRCAVDAVAIMEACYQSNRSGGWVDVRSAA